MPANRPYLLQPLPQEIHRLLTRFLPHHLPAPLPQATYLLAIHRLSTRFLLLQMQVTHLPVILLHPRNGMNYLTPQRILPATLQVRKRPTNNKTQLSLMKI